MLLQSIKNFVLYPALLSSPFAALGCQSTPGFHWSFGVDVPPTLNQTATLHPVPTMPTTTYAIEANPQQAVIARSVGVYGGQEVYQAPNIVPPQPPRIAPRPKAEPLPMPQESPCKQPCQ